MLIISFSGSNYCFQHARILNIAGKYDALKKIAYNCS